MVIAAYLLIILCLLLAPQITSSAARGALNVWALNVVPSLFPYMVFCRALANRLLRTSVPPILIAAALGILGGSPSGAAVLSLYAHRFSAKMRAALCAATGTISPMFILGTLCTWSNNAALCKKLLVCHLVGAMLAGVCAYWMTRRDCAAVCLPSASEVRSSIAQSIDAILQVGGCIICYSVAASLITCIPWVPRIFGAWLHSLMEISGGTHALLSLPDATLFTSIGLSALLGFSGFSILSQNLIFLRSFGIRMTDLVCFGCMRALGSGLCMAALTFFS